MASNTPNLQLYKKDPVTDGADVFNIETMLNENWDKIDAEVASIPRIEVINSVSSTETNKAASANSVKTAYDKANSTGTQLTTHINDSTAHGIGDKTQLSTTAKNTIVAAINEVNNKAATAQTRAETAETNAKAYTDSKLDRVDISTNIKPGTSVINTDLASDLNLTVKGETLVNLLGSDGNFENDSDGDGLADGWTKAVNGSYELSTTNIVYGAKAQKISSLTSDTNAGYRRVSKQVAVVSGKKYVHLVNVTLDSSASKAYTLVRYSDSDVATSATSTESKVHFVKFSPSANFTAVVNLYNRSDLGVEGWVQFDGAGLYEVSDELYNRIGVDITESNIRDYLPHVDGKQHVNGVVITKQGKNLLPPVPDSLHDNAKANGLYDLTLNATGVAQHSSFTFDVVPNTKYTLSGLLTGVGARVYIHTLDVSGSPNYGTSVASLNENVTSYTFTTGENIKKLFLRLSNSATGTFTFKNWQLELGDTATAFEPAKPQRLIIPETMASLKDVHDEVIVRGNETQLIKRMNTDIPLERGSCYSSGKGFKLCTSSFTTLSLSPALKKGVTFIRYDGLPFLSSSVLEEKNTAFITGDLGNGTYSTVAYRLGNEDTGWTDTINPNDNAVKALLNGWKANGNDGKVYNSWVSLLDGTAPTTNTEAYVSTNKAPGWTSYATVDYAVATPVIETIQTEGNISLHAGNNQLNVDTGIIQREKVTPYTVDGVGYINASYCTLNEKTDMILNVYKGTDIDEVWAILQRPVGHTSNPGCGRGYAKTNASNVNVNADYYVTYLVKDKYGYTTNVNDTTAQYVDGLGGVVSDAVRNIASLATENDEQEYAIDYAEAKTDNLRIDFEAQKAIDKQYVDDQFTAKVKDATTSVKGIVQLNNTTTSTSTTQAATANAVKQVADRIVNGSTTVKGMVQLSDATNSTSTTLAATANAVKKVADSVSSAKSQLDTYSGSDPSGKPNGYMWLRTDL